MDRLLHAAPPASAGACYWFQNTRQPYYNTLTAGDLDILRPLYRFYNRSLADIQARVQAQFNGTVSGAIWPETMTAGRMYNPGDWGCSTPPFGVTGGGDSTNTYIRYHFTGSLELLMFALDDWAMTQDERVLQAALRGGTPRQHPAALGSTQTIISLL